MIDIKKELVHSTNIRGQEMRRARLFVVLVVVAALAALPSAAFARNRMYQPTLGQFLQRDPLGTPNESPATRNIADPRFTQRDPTAQSSDGINQYVYVKGDPVAYSDPSGLREIKFTVTRNGNGKYASLGRFKMEADEFSTVTGYTLELLSGTYDLGRGLGPLPYPIEAGTYKAEPTTFEGHWALRLKDVPLHDGILVHRGNFVWDTTGCILVAGGQMPNAKVSRPAKVPVADWRRLVKLNMIVEADKDSTGITDRLQSDSVSTMNKIKDLYDSVKKKDGDKCTIVTVIITGGAEPASPGPKPVG